MRLPDVPPMLYQEFPPGEHLSPYVEAYWLFRAVPSMMERTVVVPLTGCTKLIVVPATGLVHFGGPVLDPQQVVVHGGDVYWGALLWPGAAAAFPALDSARRPGGCALGTTVWEERVDHDLLAALRALGPEVEEWPRGEASWVARATMALDRAVETLLPTARRLDPVVMAAVFRIVATGGGGSVDALARSLCLSPRHFRRRFSTATGISARTLARLRRLRSVTGEATRDDGDRWSAIAAKGGFADQPHLTREFQRLTGMSPDRYRDAALEIALEGIHGLPPRRSKEKPR